MRIETPWNNIPIDIDNLAGFVYCITNNLTGQKYIGKKFFWQQRSRKVPGRKNRKHYTIESDWKYYRSSCKELVEDIDKLGIENFSFDILGAYGSRSATNYHEARLQFEHNVLNEKLTSGHYAYYNKNILQSFYR